MINSKRHIFAYPSFLRAVATIGYNPLMVWKTFLHCFGGFVLFRIFEVQWFKLIAPQIKFATAQIQKSDFSKYERGKNLIQREHPSNVQLPTTRQGLHSIPNNPVKELGGFLDRTKGNLLFYSVTSIHLLLGMNIREDMFNY